MSQLATKVFIYIFCNVVIYSVFCNWPKKTRPESTQQTKIRELTASYVGF